MHNVPHLTSPPTPSPPSFLLPISLSLSFHPMSFVWRDGGEAVMEGNGKSQGRGKKREVMSPSRLSTFCLFFFFLRGKKE